MPAHPLSIRDEEQWIPSTLDDLAEVMELLDEHYSWSEMYGVADWLVRKAMGWPDPTATGTRARYRKMLRRLTDQEPVELDVPPDAGC